MTEGELTEQIVMVTELIFLGISVMFTVVSAYIVALYWFLGRAGIFLKTIAFAFFTFTLGLLGVTGFGIGRHAAGVNRALTDLRDREGLSPLGTMALEPTAAGVFTATVFGMAFLAIAIYLGLFYLSFFHRWTER